MNFEELLEKYIKDIDIAFELCQKESSVESVKEQLRQANSVFKSVTFQSTDKNFESIKDKMSKGELTTAQKREIVENYISYFNSK